MKKNVGNADRIIRLIIAVTFAVLYYAGIITGVWGIVLMTVSAIFLLTGLVSFCPLYAVFGISTCPVKKTA